MANMKNLSIVLGCIIFWQGSFATETQENHEQCPSKRWYEISGSFNSPRELTWHKTIVPDQFILDLKSISLENPEKTEILIKKFNFKADNKILGYTNDNESRAGLIYQTDIGDIYHMKTLLAQSGIHICTPGSSINASISGLPAVLSYVGGEKNKAKCMWSLQVAGLNDDVQYMFYKPVQCMEPIKTENVAKMLAVFESLMPPSAFKNK